MNNKCKIILPTSVLSPFIKYYWILDIGITDNRVRQNIPNGSIEVVIQRTPSILLNGLELPHSYICGQYILPVQLVSQQRVNVITIIFHPHGARPFFSFPLDKLENKRIDISNIEDYTWNKICKTIELEQDDNNAINKIEEFLIRKLLDFKELNFNRIKKAIQIISNDHEQSIKSIAELVCLSYRQFNRIFTDYIGLSPKEFTKVIRFQRYLNFLYSSSNHKYGQNAVDSGYYDQSHQLKDFKLFTGKSVHNFIRTNCPYSEYFGHHCIFQMDMSKIVNIEDYKCLCSLSINSGI